LWCGERFVGTLRMRFYDCLGLCRYQQAGRDPDHLKVFANAYAAEAWFAENDPEGVAFEYWVLK
jgi:hypothetical protein